jgi:hypothetical protein
MSERPKALIIIIALFIATIPWSLVFADDLFVSINEICWMGDANKTGNEWIELYNNKNSDISLEGWTLKIDSTEIKLKGNIFAKEYYLISRNKNMGADLIFSKALKNTGNKITLIDADKNVIEEIDWSKGWPAGDNKTKQTMERINPLMRGSDKNNWQTSESAKGTPKQKNSKGAVIANKESVQNIASANISQNINPQTDSPIKTNLSEKSLSLQSILFAVLISLSSGALIFFLKKSLSN